MVLRCASCGAEQPVEARFCNACGAPLYRACPGCGAEQSASAAFCSSCGFALREGAQHGAAADDRQERRVVTLLFADLAGATALGEQLDPEDVRDLQNELFELVNREVQRFGGTTEKFVGDAVLAVFGIPHVHEDDPERAVRAALGAQDRFAAFAARVNDRFGVEVGLRIGVNTGEVVAGREAAARGELMVSGDAVNVAARLQQNAAPGQVLVGERTRTATSRSVSYEAAPAVVAKGKAEPVQAWIAVEAAEEPGARGVAGLQAPLIGRDEELSILDALARRVDHERAPQLVTLYGQAGVGKSRLLAEVVLRLPDSLLLRGRCLPYGEEIAYWPLAEAAKLRAGILETDSAETALAKLRNEVEAIVPERAEQVLEALAWTIGLALPDTGAVGEEVTQRLRDSWQRYVAALGRNRLTILAVEDIHWASAALLDLVEHLADSLSGTAALIMCTARPELLEGRPSWGAGKANATSLTLSPLDGDEAAELISSLLGQEETPEFVRERVLASAEGNPFFVEEMLHMLIERGALAPHGNGWQATQALADTALPDSVHGVIAARIDLLDSSARDALRRCSVVGRVFWPAAAGVGDDAVVALGSRGLVSEQPSSTMAGMREFAFKHSLTREVAYASLPRPERRELHRRVAEWIQDVAPDRGVEAAELAAYHYGEALTYGEDDPAVSRRACELLLKAGEAALQRGAMPVAEAQLERALELARDNSTRAAALLALARLEVTIGRIQLDLSSALDRIDEVLALAHPDDASLRGDALGLRSRVCWLLGRWDEAMAAADEAVAVLRGLPESPQLARVLARRSQLAMLRSDEDARGLGLDALAVADRVGDRFARVNARINLVTVGAMHGVAPEPRTMLEIIDEAREIGAAEEAYRALVNFIWSATGYVGVDEVERVHEAAVERLQGLSPSAVLDSYLPLSIVAMQLLPAGRWDEADRLLEALDAERLTPTNRLVWLGVTAQLALRRGDLATAGEHVHAQYATALESREPQRIIPMANAFLSWATLTGEREELRSVVRELLDLVRDRWSSVISVLPSVRALDLSGDMDLLGLWAESLGRAASDAPGSRMATSHATAEGLLALHGGRASEAVERLSQVAAGDGALGYAFDAAAVDLDVARALEAAGNAKEAAAVRARADAFMRSIGCVNPL